MSLPRYPEYKDSGVNWIGSVPIHWNACRLKDIAEVINGFPFDSKLFSVDGEYALVRIRDIDAKEAAIRYSGDFVPSVAVTSSDILIGMDGDFNVGRWLGMEMALLNQRVCCVRTRSSALSVFLHYALPAPLSAINDVTYSTTVKHLSSLDVGKIIFFLPDAGELVKIASFLDSEIGRIDALIAQQERLLLLLAEKRQAIISRAVTGSLNRDVARKDSGVAWLGRIPMCWTVTPIKFLSPVQRGASPRPIEDPKYFDDDGDYAWVRIADVSASDGRLTETEQTLSELGASLSVKVEPGALFVSIAGTVGKPCITTIKACIHDGFVFFPRLRIDPMLLFRIFEAGACYAGLGKMGTQLNLNTETIGSIRIALPPEDEIVEILHFISTETEKIRELEANAEQGIKLLKERRSALISAAVTGKIDVRGLVEPKEAA